MATKMLSLSQPCGNRSAVLCTLARQKATKTIKRELKAQADPNIQAPGAHVSTLNATVSSLTNPLCTVSGGLRPFRPTGSRHSRLGARAECRRSSRRYECLGSSSECRISFAGYCATTRQPPQKKRREVPWRVRGGNAGRPRRRERRRALGEVTGVPTRL